MKRESYKKMENYMIPCMDNGAHDKEHIYRVLFNALEIAKDEKQVDYDVLIGACILHDVGRIEQLENPKLCHAKIGAQKAYQFLLENEFDEEYAVKVRDCIETHRFRKEKEPQSIEAKILFDADKVDVVGAIGIARTLMYKGQIEEPLYSLLGNGQVSDGSNDTKPSFFQEYKHKLENLYDHFYTKRGAELARERKQAAVNFYESILKEVKPTYDDGAKSLDKFIEE